MPMFVFLLLCLLLCAALLLVVYGFSAPLAQAALVFLYVLADGTYLGWKTVVFVLTAAVIAEIIEFTAGMKGAKKARGSRRSAWGALIGGFAGALILSFLGVIGALAGSFLGTFAGAFLLEFTSAESYSHAAKVGYWAMIGRLIGFCIKTAISIGIIFSVVFTGIVGMI